MTQRRLSSAQERHLEGDRLDAFLLQLILDPWQLMGLAEPPSREDLPLVTGILPEWASAQRKPNR